MDVTNLIDSYGDAAFGEACEKARRARANGDLTERLIWTQIALKVGHRSFGNFPTLLVRARSAQTEQVRKLRPALKCKRRRRGAQQERTSRRDAESGSLNLAAAERR
ncbi:hypothetical protein MOX02_54680 [Methylobacterium oxalidis]|uniref:Uncharacterized protein n=1 Tax=Methylobacterium oxalidis TaxID=944322 RepID=A0A512JBV1_9HYPH|nr:hypothetical protein MOX02_54680 [Methylobacterium oxalidis]GLS65356.1 hypothetical protein GCM10007888_37380 [Methylobacterium oxalidis]